MLFNVHELYKVLRPKSKSKSTVSASSTLSKPGHHHSVVISLSPWVTGPFILYLRKG